MSACARSIELQVVTTNTRARAHSIYTTLLTASARSKRRERESEGERAGEKNKNGAATPWIPAKWLAALAAPHKHAQSKRWRNVEELPLLVAGRGQGRGLRGDVTLSIRARRFQQLSGPGCAGGPGRLTCGVSGRITRDIKRRVRLRSTFFIAAEQRETVHTDPLLVNRERLDHGSCHSLDDLKVDPRRTAEIFKKRCRLVLFAAIAKAGRRAVSEPELRRRKQPQKFWKSLLAFAALAAGTRLLSSFVDGARQRKRYCSRRFASGTHPLNRPWCPFPAVGIVLATLSASKPKSLSEFLEKCIRYVYNTIVTPHVLLPLRMPVVLFARCVDSTT